MTPEQFLQSIRREAPAPAYLFLGPEPYQRKICREALIEKVLRPDEINSGVTRHDLEETSLSVVLDDVRSLSLFAPNRVIWVASAEAVLPKGRAAASEDDGSAASDLKRLLHDPSPGVVVVFEVSRFGFDSDDKAKLERVQKFYSAVRSQVEFRPYTPESVRRLAQDLSRQLGVQIGLTELGLLIEVLAGDAALIAIELEKLRLYAGTRKITVEDIRTLVPNSQVATIFALVGALGRGDRKRSLDTLDMLLREGEYLPLALTFLATQFRLAKIAQEAGLRNAQQIQTHFTREGIRVWRDRAEQIHQTVSEFPKERLDRAIEKVFSADKALRDARPDDRLVMEELVLNLTT